MIKTYELSESDIKEAIAFWMNKTHGTPDHICSFVPALVQIVIVHSVDRPGMDTTTLTATIKEPPPMDSPSLRTSLQPKDC